MANVLTGRRGRGRPPARERRQVSPLPGRPRGPKREVSCFRYDFTWAIKDDVVLTKDYVDEVKRGLHIMAEKWVFQLEKGLVTGRLHWQGRMHLKKTQRLKPLSELAKSVGLPGGHYTKTSIATCKKGIEFYVTKEETRAVHEDPNVVGPHYDTLTPFGEPLHPHLQDVISGKIQWYKWQQQVIDICLGTEIRRINVLVDPKGFSGKSLVASYLKWAKKAQPLHPGQTGTQLLGEACAGGGSRCYILDISRNTTASEWDKMWCFLENIKNGDLYEARYAPVHLEIRPPVLFIFANKYPYRDALSDDRWALWGIRPDAFGVDTLTPIGWENAPKRPYKFGIGDICDKLGGINKTLSSNSIAGTECQLRRPSDCNTISNLDSGVYSARGLAEGKGKKTAIVDIQAYKEFIALVARVIPNHCRGKVLCTARRLGIPLGGQQEQEVLTLYAKECVNPNDIDLTPDVVPYETWLDSKVPVRESDCSTLVEL